MTTRKAACHISSSLYRDRFTRNFIELSWKLPEGTVRGPSKVQCNATWLGQAKPLHFLMPRPASSADNKSIFSNKLDRWLQHSRKRRLRKRTAINSVLRLLTSSVLRPAPINEHLKLTPPTTSPWNGVPSRTSAERREHNSRRRNQ